MAAPEAYAIDDGTPVEYGKLILAAAAEPGDVFQYTDGRACYVVAVDDLASGDEATVGLAGTIEVPLTTSVAAVLGMDAYWDESANAVIAVPGLSVGDFFLGTFAEDKAGGTDVRAKVHLNRRSRPMWSLKPGDAPGGQGIADTVLETNGLAANGVRFLPSGLKIEFDAVSEAATASLLSGVAIPVADNILFSAIVNVETNGDASAFDLVVGLANAGHATDPDSITESVFASINGASTTINAESDDGTTEVTATDTTKTFTAGTPFALWIDARTRADIQIYVNGVLVLPNSTFTLAAATGPMKALVLAEKTANDTAAVVSVLDMKLYRIDDAAAA